MMPYKKTLLWPWLALILVGAGLLRDSFEFLSAAGLFLVLLGIGGVGGWFSGLINCQQTYDGFCLMPPEGAAVGDRYSLVLVEGGWEWVLEVRGGESC